jgi:ArsR family transcriptional regulator
VEPCGPRLSASPLTKSEAAEAAEVFKAMASAERLQLLSLIAGQPGGECGCNLLEPTDLAQPTVSYHLKLLYQAGLVEREQRGTSVYFRVRRAGFDAIRRLLEEFDP